VEWVCATKNTTIKINPSKFIKQFKLFMNHDMLVQFEINQLKHGLPASVLHEKQKGTVISEIDALKAENETLKTNNNTLKAENETLKTNNNTLKAELNRLM